MEQPQDEDDRSDGLPTTCQKLHHDGIDVYIVGTAHFSKESQDDVRKVIKRVRPRAVMLELCESRTQVLSLDEKELLHEAKAMTTDRIYLLMKQHGPAQGILHYLMLKVSAEITETLGMAPGGEFRAALDESRNLGGVNVHLLDRPVAVTLRRAFASLNAWQRIRLAFHMFFTNPSITREEIEEAKEKDVLERLLIELSQEYPTLNRVLVEERDLFLAYSLMQLTRAVSLAPPSPSWQNSQVAEDALRGSANVVVSPKETQTQGCPPHLSRSVVAVVGIGHQSGIVRNWGTQINIRPLLVIPPEKFSNRVMRHAFRLSGYALIGLCLLVVSRRIAPHRTAFLVTAVSKVALWPMTYIERLVKAVSFS